MENVNERLALFLENWYFCRNTRNSIPYNYALNKTALTRTYLELEE
jgi:hypothetical protein